MTASNALRNTLRVCPVWKPKLGLGLGGQIWKVLEDQFIAVKPDSFYSWKLLLQQQISAKWSVCQQQWDHTAFASHFLDEHLQTRALWSKWPEFAYAFYSHSLLRCTGSFISVTFGLPKELMLDIIGAGLHLKNWGNFCTLIKFDMFYLCPAIRVLMGIQMFLELFNCHTNCQERYTISQIRK